jgi:glycosyltransferase involved in cell wall biosynthesis
MIDKKKIAFIISEMSQGGPARGLLNLLMFIDRSVYEIDIILISEQGTLLKEIPLDFNIRKVLPRSLFSQKLEKDAISYFYIPLQLTLNLIGKIMVSYFGFPVEIKWQLKKHFIKPIREKYTFAMAFSESESLYLLNDKIDSSIKACRIATDHSSSKLDTRNFTKYFHKMNYLVCVSPSTYQSFISIYPEIKNKSLVIENIIAKDHILKQSQFFTTIFSEFTGLKILTLARLETSKGIDLILETSKKLKSKNISFLWLILGRGNHTYYNNLIAQANLSENLKIQEPQPNPYPYLRECDIYIQPSRYEGKSNSVNEAKILRKLIILTNYTSSSDQINNNENGMIVKMSSEEIFKGIIKLYSDKDYCKKLKDNLSQFEPDNENEIQKLYKLINAVS